MFEATEYFFMEEYFVYAIYSLKARRIYVGLSSDVENRVIQHNSGKTQSTKSYIPWKLFYFEKHKSRVEARKREIYLKSGSGKEFLKEILRQFIQNSES